ncbi:chemotaxis protein CheW [Methanolobus sp. WCC5]|jgi:purine-binding chemotaxis protein CheW|uniref:chemotaxis protein CheW n=1 Tax=Methanolobus sp. WCC5 TaxID=3125785 RepID=UPI00324EF625
MAEYVEKDSSSSKELLQLVICQLASEEFGIEISRVKEIIRIPDITKIPQVPDYVEGIINLRDRIIPVIHLAERFGLAREVKDEDSRIVVVEIGNLTAGMVVDSVTEVLRMSGDDIEPAPDIIVSGVSEKYIRGVGKLEDRLLILLDIDMVFTEEQKQQMSQLENAGAVPA